MRLAIVALLILATTVSAQEPAVVVRAKSYQTLVEQGKTLFDQLGLGATAAKVGEMLNAKAGAKGLNGLDATRPIGAFLRFDPDPSGALLVPITTEADFLALLDRLDFKTLKEADGAYRMAIPFPVPAYVKFGDRYAWITLLNKAGFAGKLDPAQTLAGPAALSATVRLERIPKDARQLAVAHFEDALQEAAKKNPPTDTPAHKAFQKAWNEMFVRLLGQILNEGKDVEITLDVDAAKKELSANATLTPLPGTALAQTLVDAGKRASVFATPATGAALSARVNVALPETLSGPLAALVEEGYKEGTANLRDPEKKKQSEDLWAAIKPSLVAGELDVVFRLVGPSGDKFGALAGVKIVQGGPLGDLFRTLVADAKKQMPAAEQAKVMLDAETVGATKIHRFTLPADKGPLGNAQDVLGESTLSLAFRPDAALASVGTESLAAIKTLAAATDAAPAGVLSIDADVARLAPLIAPTPELKDSAKKFFVQPDDGHIRILAEAGPALRVHFTVKTPVLQFLGQTREVKAQK